jgi:hypothetical protein
VKASEALIAWTPLDADIPTRGQLEVGLLVSDNDRDWTAPYSHTGGAAHLDRRAMRGAESVIRLLRDFQYLVVEERLDPEAVHKAFLKIDEYAEMFGGPKEFN